MSSQAPPSGVKNNSIPVRITACSRNRRLRCECCLNTVSEHPGASNRWLREPQEHQKGSQENPERHRGATRSTRSETKRAPNGTQKEAKRAMESTKAKCVKQSEMSAVKIVLPPRRGHDFRCQRRGEGRVYFRLMFGTRMAPLEIPWVLRCAQKTLTMINSICLEIIYCFSSRLISVKPLRAGRFTPCEPSSGRF